MNRVIEGAVVVFCPLASRNEEWVKLGVPEAFIHHSGFEDVMQQIITRQTALMKEPRPFDTKINIILDYKKDREVDPTPEVFWDRQFGMVAKQEIYKDLGIVFHLNYENIIKVNHIASFRNMQKEWKRQNPL